MTRVLGLDFGTRRVGAAVSDPRRSIATPLEVYERRDRRQRRRALSPGRRGARRRPDRRSACRSTPAGGESESSGLARRWGAWLGRGDGPAGRLLRRAVHDRRRRGRAPSAGLKLKDRKAKRGHARGADPAPELPRRRLPRAPRAPPPLLDAADADRESSRPEVQTDDTLIVGCGYLGLRVGRLLAERGDRVFGTTRSRGRAAELAATPGSSRSSPTCSTPSRSTASPRPIGSLYCVGFDRSAGVPMRTVYVNGLRHALGRPGRPGRVARLRQLDRGLRPATTAAGSTRTRRPSPGPSRAGPAWRPRGWSASLGAAAACRRSILRFSGLYGPGRIMRRDGRR